MIEREGTVAKGFSEKPAQRLLHTVSLEARRLAVTGAIEVVSGMAFTSEVIEKGGALTKVNEMLEDGRGVVMLSTHVTERELIDIMAHVAWLISKTRQRKVVIPIAVHQFRSILPAAAKIMDVDFMSIVTLSTKLKEELLRQQGKNIPWKIMPINTGLREYLREARAALRKGGFVFVAPQATRQPYLGQFEGAPVEHLFKSALNVREGHKLPQLGIVFVGVKIQGVTNYEDPKIRGVNLYRRYSYTFGHARPFEEFQERAKTHGLSWDMEALYEMDDLAPPGYKVPDHQIRVQFDRLRAADYSEYPRDLAAARTPKKI